MKLEDIGYNSYLDIYLTENGFDKSNIGRISAVHRNRYVITTDSAEISASLTGNFQFSVNDSSELPTIGDWVYLNIYDDGQALITHLLPRHNRLERRAVGREAESQLIAANIDYGLIVESVGENFKLNRIERYIAICNSSDIKPIIIITKIDLIDSTELNELMESVFNRISGVPLYTISNIDKQGFDKLNGSFIKGKTYCLLGLSGVGKSTLINNLIGKDIIKTLEISESTNKGVHTTTHRELFLLNNGSIIIDNPGMREIGLTDSSDSLDLTFRHIAELSKNCQFSNCSHTHERGCAVLKAIKEGTLEQNQYNNYLKMQREQFHYTASVAEKRKKDKEFGKMVKNVMKHKTLKRS